MVDGHTSGNGLSAQHHVVVELSRGNGLVKILLLCMAELTARVMEKKPKIVTLNPAQSGFLPGPKTSCGAVLEFLTVTLA